MIFKKILLIFSFALVSACATQIAITPSEASARLAKANLQGKQLPLIIEVPSADSGLSNQIIATSLASGSDSNASKSIRTTLESGKSIAVISKSESVLCATLNRALQDIQPISISNVGVTVFGNKETCSSINALAESKGLLFNVIPYP